MVAGWDLPEIDFEGAAAQWAGEQARPMADAVRDTVPYKTGATQGTIEGAANGGDIEVSGDLVAHFLQSGTQAHEIHGNPWLVFEDRDGQTVFLDDRLGEFVHHPGTGPDPYVENAIDAKEQDLVDALLDKVAAQWSA